jgi:hypothetical protein
MDSSDDDPKGPGFPIRRSTDQKVLALPRGLSQRATSFIASQCQGIHQMPLSRLIRSFRNVTRRDKSLHLSLNTSVTQHFPHCRPQTCATITNTGAFEDEDNRCPWRRERPRLRPATLSYPRCQRSRRTCDRCRATPGPSIVSSQYRQTLRTPSRSGRPSLVELTGFEPATPCLQSRCSPN